MQGAGAHSKAEPSGDLPAPHGCPNGEGRARRIAQEGSGRLECLAGGESEYPSRPQHGEPQRGKPREGEPQQGEPKANLLKADLSEADISTAEISAAKPQSSEPDPCEPLWRKPQRSRP